MNETPCTQEDIEALLDVHESWEVDNKGNPTDFLDSTGSMGSGDEVVEYVCRNCGDYFGVIDFLLALLNVTVNFLLDARNDTTANDFTNTSFHVS
jgi:hypothetical protein